MLHNFQLHEEDDVSDWEEGDATDEALEVPRRVPFPEFGGDIVHNTGKSIYLDRRDLLITLYAVTRN